MEGISSDKLYDLWKVTLEAYDWADTENLSVLLPRYHWFICDDYMPQHEFETGTQIKRQVQYAEGTATWTRPAKERVRSASRYITDFTAPWVGIYGEMTLTAAEMRRNMGKAKLKSLRKSRRIGSRLGILKEIEQRMWMVPDSSTDDLHPRGFPYYLVPITLAQVAAATYVAYQGRHPSGFSDCGGIDCATTETYARWRNLNAAWTNNGGSITETDMKRLGQVFRRMHWSVPKQASDIRDNAALRKLRIGTTEAVLDSYSRFVRQQHDNLGADGGRFYGAGIGQNGEPTFKGYPITWVEDLDNTAAAVLPLTVCGYNPWYFLNLGVFKPIFEEGMFFVEDTPPRDWRQPDVFTTFTDCWFQNFCENRQSAGAVVSYPYA